MSTLILKNSCEVIYSSLRKSLYYEDDVCGRRHTSGGAGRWGIPQHLLRLFGKLHTPTYFPREISRFNETNLVPLKLTRLNYLMKRKCEFLTRVESCDQASGSWLSAGRINNSIRRSGRVGERRPLCRASGRAPAAVSRQRTCFGRCVGPEARGQRPLPQSWQRIQRTRGRRSGVRCVCSAAVNTRYIINEIWSSSRPLCLH